MSAYINVGSRAKTAKETDVEFKDGTFRIPVWMVTFLGGNDALTPEVRERFKEFTYTEVKEELWRTNEEQTLNRIQQQVIASQMRKVRY